jgi:hypothetical protein
MGLLVGANLRKKCDARKTCKSLKKKKKKKKEQDEFRIHKVMNNRCVYKCLVGPGIPRHTQWAGPEDYPVKQVGRGSVSLSSDVLFPNRTALKAPLFCFPKLPTPKEVYLPPSLLGTP